MSVFVYLLPLLALAARLAAGAISASQIITLINDPQSQWEQIEALLDQGSFAGFPTYEETYDVFKNVSSAFPDLTIQPRAIGYTYEEREIMLFGLSALPKNQNPGQVSSVFLNGLHHAREPVTISMEIYAFTRLLHAYTHGCNETRSLMDRTILWFLPIVNIDSLIVNQEQYKQFKNIDHSYVRKNRRPNDCVDSTKNGVGWGVDLNRNYAYMWGIDDKGSNSNPCAEDYRGEGPFSEPETKSIKTFVDAHRKIKLAFNFHNYGNLWITPYNYQCEKSSGNAALKQERDHFQIYDELRREVKFPDNYLFGDAQETIQYCANGESSDWMLHEHNIISFSPELGTDNKHSDYADEFYVRQPSILATLRECYAPVRAIMGRMTGMPQIVHAHTLVYLPSMTSEFLRVHPIKQVEDTPIYRVVSVTVFNRGFLDAPPSHESVYDELYVKFVNSEGSLLESVYTDLYAESWYYKNQIDNKPVEIKLDKLQEHPYAKIGVDEYIIYMPQLQARTFTRFHFVVRSELFVQLLDSDPSQYPYKELVVHLTYNEVLPGNRTIEHALGNARVPYKNFTTSEEGAFEGRGDGTGPGTDADGDETAADNDSFFYTFEKGVYSFVQEHHTTAVVIFVILCAGGAVVLGMLALRLARMVQRNSAAAPRAQSHVQLHSMRTTAVSVSKMDESDNDNQIPDDDENNYNSSD